MVEFYHFLSQRCHLSGAGAARLVLLSSIILWFLAGCLLGYIVSLFLPEYRFTLIISIGSFFGTAMGFLFEMIQLLKYE